jgi:hypothetical protein
MLRYGLLVTDSSLPCNRDLRARLEVSVDHVIKLQHEALHNDIDDTDYASDCDEVRQ